MATFQKIPVDEARRQSMPPRRAVSEQYRQYIRTLANSEDGQVAGRLSLEEGDRPITERARLKAAAKAEGYDLQIQRRGSTILFWGTESDAGDILDLESQGEASADLGPEPESEPEPTPSRGRGKNGSNGGRRR